MAWRSSGVDNDSMVSNLKRECYGTNRLDNAGAVSRNRKSVGWRQFSGVVARKGF